MGRWGYDMILKMEDLLLHYKTPKKQTRLEKLNRHFIKLTKTNMIQRIHHKINKLQNQ